ncbi:7125_t:CDS:2, partial [Acaulospora morrowiae]
MTEYRSRLVELTSYSGPPKIITDDGVVQVEIFSSEKESLYRKGFTNSKETTNPVDLTVAGNLPEWLSGELFTVGPGTFDVKYNKMIEVEGGYETGTLTFSVGHWFDGLPLVNRFVLDGRENKVNYRSRLTSKTFESKIRDHHGILTRHPYSLFKTHANQTPLSKFLGKKRTTKPGMEPCAASININFPLNTPGEKPKVYCQNHSSQIVGLDADDLTPIQ